jgi:NAD(P)H dehydrogenase (quinone)
MSTIAIAYHSGYGHTARIAEHIAKGARGTGAKVELINVDGITEKDWLTLDAADAIIFGAPTYMGGASAQFKAFEDLSSGRFMTQSWKGKLAAGFSNSGSPSGDKLSTLVQIFLFAQQHGMLWQGLGVFPNEFPKGNEFVTKDAVNRIGSFAGLMTQANNDAAENTFTPGDLKTAELFGANVATTATKMAGLELAAVD